MDKYIENEISKSVEAFYNKIDIIIIDAIEEPVVLPRDLSKVHFTCPTCHNRQTADNLVITESPLQFSNDGTKYTVSMNVKLTCRNCVNKL